VKISVIGAGPAGSTAAYFLAHAGIDVEIIDKQEFPRNKPCAGGLFNPLLYYKDFPWVESTVGKYIYKVKFYCGKHSAEYISKRPLLKLCLRKDFDYFLLKKALDEGAKFFVNKRPDPESDIIIKATGARNIKDYPEAGCCMVNNFKTDKAIDTVHIHYGFNGIKGYAWLYPKEGYANIGVGAYLPQDNIKVIYKNYIDFLVKNSVVSIRKKVYNGAIIPFAHIKRFYTKKSLIVGDAAGFVRPSTGEGIYFAMLSGKIAADTIINKRPLSSYERECRKRFGEFGGFGEWMNPVRFGFSTSFLNRILEKAVRISKKDDIFLKMVAQDFFRLEYHKFGKRFLRDIFK